MTDNQSILKEIFPIVCHLPEDFSDLNIDFFNYMLPLVAESTLHPEFKQYFWQGGYGQGDYASYSVLAFWPKGKHQYSKGSFSYVQAGLLYLSHTIPITLLCFGDALWRRSPRGVTPPSWKVGEKILHNKEIPAEWEEAVKCLQVRLSNSIFTLVDLEYINSPLPKDLINQYEYPHNLDLKPPELIKDLLFYKGIDWDY